MPKRLIDGEALWRSNKMLIVSPEYRAEYANLIPLAEADGTFQADARKVWSEVYSYNREDITVDIVEEILISFEEAGMLVRKKDEKGIVWGKFVGIESRLPAESHRDRYKQGNPTIFNNVRTVQINSGPTPDVIHTGEVEVGNGFGLGKDKDMDRMGNGAGTFKNIAILYSSFFGINHSHNKKHIEKYQHACRKYGEDKVLQYFNQWAATVEWLKAKKDSNGLNLFWRPLEEIAEGDILYKERNQPKERKTIDNLKYELPESDLTPEEQEKFRYTI